MRCDFCGWDMDGIEDNQCLQKPGCWNALVGKVDALQRLLDEARESITATSALREQAEKELGEALAAIEALRETEQLGKGQVSKLPGPRGKGRK